jgi:hypothetical protein
MKNAEERQTYFYHPVGSLMELTDGSLAIFMRGGNFGII